MRFHCHLCACAVSPEAAAAGETSSTSLCAEPPGAIFLPLQGILVRSGVVGGTTTGNLEPSQCQINVAYSWMDGLPVSQLAEFPCITRTWGLQAGRTPAREEKGFRGTLVRKGWALAVRIASSPHANLLPLLFSNPSRPACRSSCYDAWADPRPFSDRGFSTRARPPHRTSQLCSDHRGAEIR